MARARIGVWFVGAKGGVASTATVGLLALRKGLIGGAGLTSELPRFADVGLAPWKDFVAIGGHEIRDVRSYDEALRMHSESRAIDPDVLAKCKSDLERVDRQIRPGTIANVGPTISALASPDIQKRQETARACVDRLQDDLRRFAAENKLSHTIVVNVSSTEPPSDAASLPERWAAFEKLLDKPRCALPASTLYAIAALDLGCSFINFTPSLAATPPAVNELAELRGARHMGYDGKTGETLLKSVLAPMFAKRNLHVMSWVGHNIFGNMDGKVLDDPANKRAKVTSKDRLLGQILGYAPQTLVSIEYIESLRDWKTAWDHIHFQGFLGTPMTFQFIWQGCDSILAAPLVLDLIRFTERACRAGDTGTMRFLSCFFKSPLGTAEQDFGIQFQMLEAWCDRLAERERAKA